MIYETGGSPDELRREFYEFCPFAKILAGTLDGAEVKEYGGILRVDKAVRVHWLAEVRLKLQAIARFINSDICHVNARVGQSPIRFDQQPRKDDTELVAGIDFSPYDDRGNKFLPHNTSIVFNKDKVGIRFSVPTFEHEPENSNTRGLVMRGYYFRKEV